MFRIVKSDSSARLARLSTLHGVLETPVFLPVATKATAKHLSPHELSALGSKAIICNSFLLSLRPGVKLVKKFGGLHKFMDWHNVIFTDSGGFQILSEPFFKKTTPAGGYFKSPFDGQTSFLSPEKAIGIQESLGSDVMMCLDEMPLFSQTKNQVAASTRMTHSWARKCLAARKNRKHLLFGICQGGIYPDLRKESAKLISSLDFDGISIGGLAVGEPQKKMLDMLKVVEHILPEDKPHYLMGVGSPDDMIKAISLGVDIFDSAFPTQSARHGTLFTFGGKLKITNVKYREDRKSVEKDCDCYLCRSFSRAYLHHLFRINEPFGLRLASMHNIRFINRFIGQVKLAIKDNNLEKYKARFLRSFC
ncbi:MAG: tRNA guanosine(34) transglycosylase Tgt [Candidatus Woesearchaeota archaeon]